MKKRERFILTMDRRTTKAVLTDSGIEHDWKVSPEGIYLFTVKCTKEQLSDLKDVLDNTITYFY